MYISIEKVAHFDFAIIKRIGFSDAFKREGNGLLIPSFHGIASESFPCIF